MIIYFFNTSREAKEFKEYWNKDEFVWYLGKLLAELQGLKVDRVIDNVFPTRLNEIELNIYKKACAIVVKKPKSLPPGRRPTQPGGRGEIFNP